MDCGQLVMFTWNREQDTGKDNVSEHQTIVYCFKAALALAEFKQFAAQVLTYWLSQR